MLCIFHLQPDHAACFLWTASEAAHAFESGSDASSPLQRDQPCVSQPTYWAVNKMDSFAHGDSQAGAGVKGWD